VGFGVANLYALLGGIGFLAIHKAKDAAGEMEYQSYKEWSSEFLREYTDIELENKLLADIFNPSCHERIWERLEKFKRDNPLVCKRVAGHMRKDEYIRTSYCAGKEQQHFRKDAPRFSWDDIGNGRPEAILINEHGWALQMLMMTYGKMTEQRAQLELKRIRNTGDSQKIW